MSFMFKPLPWDDQDAVNHIRLDEALLSDLTYGTVKAAQRVARELVKAGKGTVVCVDGYASAHFDPFATALLQALRQAKVSTARAEMRDVYKSTAELDAMVAPNLPKDYDEDPVLLFGRLFKGGYADFFDQSKWTALRQKAAAVGQGEVLVVTGYGASAALPDALHIFIDVTPKTCAIRARSGELINIGDTQPRPFAEMMRRNYYVDFEMIVRHRKALLQSGKVAYYICGDHDEDFVLMKGATEKSILSTLARYPLRTKPVYLEGIWGGEFIRKVRNLPMDAKNVAWVFDMIPMEVSVVTECGGKTAEFPFSTFLAQCPDELMGAECAKEFGGYFPIRFNYDDTWHSNGNMSVQCHPDAGLCTKMYDEIGSQDEAYYIIDAGHGARTYLGFNEDADTDEFIALAKKSEKDGSVIDYQKYVSHVSSVPGRQVMIPGGTIHASGRNQLILELGSLTIGSYTYKMYDYNRRDAEGNLRPIHSAMGQRALHTERRSKWVDENIAIEPLFECRGEGWEQHILGKTDLMYYMTRRLDMEPGAAAAFENEGAFTVLTLVDGEEVLVRSKSHPELCYHQKFLDIVLVPASISDYEIVNIGYQPAVVHKTMLRENFAKYRHLDK
jgi:mannose-6-phosphate isomerase class I